MRIDKDTTYAEFYFYLDTFNVPQEKIDNLFNDLERHPLPDIFNVSFDGLKFKQLIELQTRIKTAADMMIVPFEVVLGFTLEDLLHLSAFDCIRFAIHSKNELERITKLFKDIEYKPSSEEERAGIGRLSHGFFGTIDWYARRMGIKDHDEVTELSWVRIYKCLQMDFENNKFEKRYRQIVSQQNKRK